MTQEARERIDRYMKMSKYALAQTLCMVKGFCASLADYKEKDHSQPITDDYTEENQAQDKGAARAFRQVAEYIDELADDTHDRAVERHTGL